MSEFGQTQQDSASQETPLPQIQNGKSKALYPRDQNGKLLDAAYTLMVITTIIMGISIFPTFGIAFVGLAWCIPITILIRRVRDGKMANTAVFGVCCLLIAGIIPVGLFIYVFWWGVGVLFSIGIVPGILLLAAKKDE